ncbi:DUF4252 domain-containing protein [Tamlana fucoidanivorans]|uniref:DUF4252 domain-containing protein n=1 Tax=Allotamlana fucoidanivorans TaxID=2583814 RepID=A0A5C4SIA1_9FLAO|nr:DUF4252 domain-containing protein [Tamlana fucoidanivorans]TNJ43454.1 DUF4252 domain-containing protein [Tamlana fucoidanivorans]
MKRTIKHFLSLFTAVILVNCGNSGSLQGYYVEHQETKNFISQDFPLSMIEIDKSQFSEEQKEAYASVDKLNFLGYKASDDNVEQFNAELAEVNRILSDSKYQELMELRDKGNKISVKYIGTDDEADEIVLFGSSKDMGFGIVRVLGDNMSPDKMVTLIHALQKANIQEKQLDDIMNFFK